MSCPCFSYCLGFAISLLYFRQALMAYEIPMLAVHPHGDHFWQHLLCLLYQLMMLVIGCVDWCLVQVSFNHLEGLVNYLRLYCRVAYVSSVIPSLVWSLLISDFMSIIVVYLLRLVAIITNIRMSVDYSLLRLIWHLLVIIVIDEWLSVIHCLWLLIRSFIVVLLEKVIRLLRGQMLIH